MAQYKLTVSHERDEEREHILESGLRRFNDETSRYHLAARGRPDAAEPLSVFLMGVEGRVVGGVTGWTTATWEWLHVSTLWIADEARGQGYGRVLMETIENEARARGCRHADLRTFSFQAPQFYRKLGYRVVGELEDYPPGESFLWLRKDL